jgi:hypothetical protein
MNERSKKLKRKNYIERVKKTLKKTVEKTPKK